MRSFFEVFVITVKGSIRRPKNLDLLNTVSDEITLVESLSTEFNAEQLVSLHNGKAVYYLTVGRDLSLAEIGCAYGHYLAYKSLLKTTSEWALVLEDDANMDLPVDPLLEEINKLRGPAVISLIDRRGGVENPFQRQGGELIKLLLPSQATSAYLINKQAAKIYLENFNEFGVLSPSDWPFPHPREISFYATHKPYFIHNWSDQDSLVAIGRSLTIANGFYNPEILSNFSARNALKRLYSIRLLGISYRKSWYTEVELKLKCIISLKILALKKRLKKF